MARPARRDIIDPPLRRAACAWPTPADDSDVISFFTETDTGRATAMAEGSRPTDSNRLPLGEASLGAGCRSAGDSWRAMPPENVRLVRQSKLGELHARQRELEEQMAVMRRMQEHTEAALSARLSKAMPAHAATDVRL
eukprot:4498535-Pleurochrysis_carterae.AAC.3